MFADDITIFTIGESVEKVSIVLQEVMNEVRHGVTLIS